MAVLASEAGEAVAVAATAVVADLVASVARSPTTSITDLHRNFTPDEWERLGTMRSNVLQLREGSRRGR